MCICILIWEILNPLYPQSILQESTTAPANSYSVDGWWVTLHWVPWLVGLPLNRQWWTKGLTKWLTQLQIHQAWLGKNSTQMSIYWLTLDRTCYDIVSFSSKQQQNLTQIKYPVAKACSLVGCNYTVFEHPTQGETIDFLSKVFKLFFLNQPAWGRKVSWAHFMLVTVESAKERGRKSRDKTLNWERQHACIHCFLFPTCPENPLFSDTVLNNNSKTPIWDFHFPLS